MKKILLIAVLLIFIAAPVVAQGSSQPTGQPCREPSAPRQAAEGTIYEFYVTFEIDKDKPEFGRCFVNVLDSQKPGGYVPYDSEYSPSANLETCCENFVKAAPYTPDGIRPCGERSSSYGQMMAKIKYQYGCSEVRLANPQDPLPNCTATQTLPWFDPRVSQLESGCCYVEFLCVGAGTQAPVPPAQQPNLCNPCDGDGQCDQGESCNCQDCEGQQDSCVSGAVCSSAQGICVCMEGLVYNSVAKACEGCNGNNVCDSGESCFCGDCVGAQNGCQEGKVCVQETIATAPDVRATTACCGLPGQTTCTACNNNKVCEAGESCGCADCDSFQNGCPADFVCDFYSQECKPCNSNRICDADEGCYCSDCRNRQDGCPLSQVCIKDPNGGSCCAQPGETNCAVCNNDNSCDPLEDCGCTDCDGEQNGCQTGFSCDFFSKECQPCNFNDNCEYGEGCYCEDCLGQQAYNCEEGKICIQDPADGSCCAYPDETTCAGCNNNGFCDPGEGCTCDDCSLEERCSFCNYDKKCEENETCTCIDCHGQLDACNPGQICSYQQKDCVCPIGETLCEDGSCSKFCPPMGCLIQDGVCQDGEGCGCLDCFGQQNGCAPGMVCDETTFMCACGPGLLQCPDGTACVDDLSKCQLVPDWSMSIKRDPVNVGEIQTVTVTTSIGAPLANIPITITLPNGTAVGLATDQKGEVRFQVKEPGRYTVEAKRANQVQQRPFRSFDLLTALLNVPGEAIAALVSALDNLGMWLLPLLLLLALVAAAVTYKRSEELFRRGVKAFSLQRREQTIKLALAITAFAVPILIALLTKYSVGIVVALAEIAAVLIGFYAQAYYKRQLSDKPIFVAKPKY